MMRLAPKTTKAWTRTVWFAIVRAVRSVVLLEDRAERIARGSAIGLFFTFQLLVVSQIAFALLFCKILRANVLASVPWTLISNPFTGVPIYYSCYWIGCLVYPQENELGWKDFEEILGDGFTWQTLVDIWHKLPRIIIPLQIGSTIVSVIFALAGYVVIRRAVIFAQHRRTMRRKGWHESAKKHRADTDNPHHGHTA
jgi:uncharacterized protein